MFPKLFCTENRGRGGSTEIRTNGIIVALDLCFQDSFQSSDILIIQTKTTGDKGGPDAVLIVIVVVVIIVALLVVVFGVLLLRRYTRLYLLSIQKY